MSILSCRPGRVIAVDDSIELYTQIKIIKCSNSNFEGNVQNFYLDHYIYKDFSEGITSMTDMLRVLGGIAIITLDNSLNLKRPGGIER